MKVTACGPSYDYPGDENLVKPGDENLVKTVQEMREPILPALVVFFWQKNSSISVISFFSLQLYRPWDVDFFAKKKNPTHNHHPHH